MSHQGKPSKPTVGSELGLRYPAIAKASLTELVHCCFVNMDPQRELQTLKKLRISLEAMQVMFDAISAPPLSRPQPLSFFLCLGNRFLLRAFPFSYVVTI